VRRFIGDASPARSSPSITQSAPAAIALGISPVANSSISYYWNSVLLVLLQLQELQKIEGNHTTIRVVQIEPGPIPTFTPSAPFSTGTMRLQGSNITYNHINIRIYFFFFQRIHNALSMPVSRINNWRQHLRLLKLCSF
jgi:hypothetical protein